MRPGSPFAWDEDAHPRGQPDNPGQFAPAEGEKKPDRSTLGGTGGLPPGGQLPPSKNYRDTPSREQTGRLLDADAEGHEQVRRVLAAHGRMTRLADEVRRHQERIDALHATLDGMADAGRTAGREYARTRRQLEQAFGDHRRVRDRLCRECLRPLDVPDPARVAVRSIATADPALRESVGVAARYLAGLVSKRVSPHVLLQVESLGDGQGRNQHDPATGGLRLHTWSDPADVLHEIGHYIERRNPAVAELAEAFLDYRCGDEPFRPLADEFPGMFEHGEEGRPDDFGRVLHPEQAWYVGKKTERGGSEVLTHGLELLYNDPAGFALRDPEYFRVVSGMLSGRLLP